MMQLLLAIALLFRMIDPTALELSDGHEAATAATKLPAGAVYKLRKVDVSSLRAFCFKVSESDDDGKSYRRSVSMGCYPAGHYSITFDHDETVMEGGAGRAYGFAATRVDGAGSYQVFFRALIELLPQYQQDPAPSSPPPVVTPAQPPPKK